MGSRYVLYFLLLFVIVLSAILFFRDTGTGFSEDPCVIQRQLFFEEIRSGILAEKSIEEENHALKKVIIKNNSKEFALLFIPFKNWEDFDKIKVGDSVVKRQRSFEFIVNRTYKFKLHFDCKYLNE